MTGNSTGFGQMLETARMQVRAFNSHIQEESSRSFREIGKSFIAGFTGMLAFEGIKGAIESFVETGNQIKDISEQLGMSTQEWQKWSDAVAQAGLQTEGFARVMESLKQKRTAALTDPKARAQLNQLGFSDAEISGSMSTSDFAAKAFRNSNMNPYAKSSFDAIAGVEGVRYTRALDYLPQSQAVFSPEMIEAAQKTQIALHELGETVDKVKLGMIRSWLSGGIGTVIIDFLTGKSGKQAAQDQAAAEKAWTQKMNYQPAVAMRDGVPLTPDQSKQVAKDIGDGLAHDLSKEFGGGSKPANTAIDTTDPLYAVLQQQQRDMAIRDQDRQQRLDDSQRELMTIGDRRRSIEGEVARLKPQIAAHEKALSTPEGFLTDAQRNALTGVTGLARTIQVNELREKYQDETASLREQLNKDRADLRQSPLSFQADSMAKVGLYSASALRFNPVLNLQQTANHYLQKIAMNTSKPNINPPSDPFRP
jgi:hypothetical protein